MKDHIQNFSLLHSTLSKRLFVVTGKGGTGKTTVALALSHALKLSGKKVLLYQSIPDQSQEIAKQLDIPLLNLELYQSAEEYIARKLGQKTIASWVLKAPFFKSLLDILPSLGDMILLGHLIDILESDQELTIVMDAPSTGHTLSFFESPKNFKSIFKTGALARDIDRIMNFLNTKDNLYFLVTSLPNAMAIQESLELISQLDSFGFESKAEAIINNYLNESPSLKEYKDHIPDFLAKKIAMEDEALKEIDATLRIPFFIHKTQKELINETTLKLEHWEIL